MKKCSKCGVAKELAEFYADRQKKDGRAYVCKECDKAKQKKRRGEHPDRVRASNASWQHRNEKVFRGHKAKWRAKNKQHLTEYNAQWVETHRGLHNAKGARRRAAELQATPAWTNHIAVGEFYALAALKTKLTGEQWHVDHIVPLQNKKVCGLHTHYNLQVLLGSDNKSKGNHYWPDMPEQGART